MRAIFAPVTEVAFDEGFVMNDDFRRVGKNFPWHVLFQYLPRKTEKSHENVI